MLSQIPGFRSGTTWKKVVASCGYFTWALVILALATSVAGHTFSRGALLWFLVTTVAVFALAADIGHVRARLPIRKPWLQVAAWSAVISFATMAVAITIPESPQYLAYKAQQTAQRETGARALEEAEQQQTQQLAEHQEADRQNEQEPAAEQAPPAASPGDQPTPAAAEPPGRLPPAPSAEELTAVTVVSVVDGDTLKVDFGDTTESLRLIGVDTPETVHPNRPVQAYGVEASAYTKSRLAGQTVQLEFDVEQRDRYGRLLAYVWLGDEFFNATLVREGYAQVATFPPNVKYADLFVALQREARENQRGLWGMETGSAEPVPTPAPGPTPAPSAPPSSGGHDPYAHMDEDHDCSDFGSSEEATAFMLRSIQAGYGDHRLDRDKDGIACEAN